MRITVAGAGYVGLVTSVCLADLGHQVTCIDIQKEKIDLLQEGQCPIYEPGLESLLKTASLTIVKDLLEEGAVVTAYDPIAIPNAKRALGNTIQYVSDIGEALHDAELAIIATEWDQIKHIPLELYPKRMKVPIVMDGRNCYPLSEIQKYPITYISIGRPTINNRLSKTKI